MPRPDPSPALPKGAKVGAAAAIAAAVAIAAPIGERWEGTILHPYLDPAKILTVCTGETDPAFIEDRLYSKDECSRQFRLRLARDYAPGILKCLPELETQHVVFGALLDASYNAGIAAVCEGFKPLVEAGEWRAACDKLPGWYVTAKNRKTGVRFRLPGLVNRRKDEARVCRAGLT